MSPHRRKHPKELGAALEEAVYLLKLAVVTEQVGISVTR